mgnify:CR=1 FL=1
MIANSSKVLTEHLPVLINDSIQIDFLKKELTVLSTGQPCSPQTFENNIARIRNNFEGVNPAWVKEIVAIVKEQKLTDQEFTDLVTTVMRSATFTGKPPAVALFKIEKAVIPLFTMTEIDFLVHKGQANYSDFGIVHKEPGKPVLLGKRADMFKHGVKEIPPTSLYQS